MENNIIRKKFIILTLLVGNSVFMMLLGPIQLAEHTYSVISSYVGIGFLYELVKRIAAGIIIIISYAVILLIIVKFFPDKDKEKEKIEETR